MILEVAILDVKADRTGAFQLQRWVEKPNRYLLLVRWRKLEEHYDSV